MTLQPKSQSLARRIITANLAVGLTVMLAAPSFAADLRVTKAEKVGMSTERLARIEPFFKEQYTDKGQLGSVITLVARHGKIVHVGMSGYKDMASQTPVAQDDLFRIYSMTKPITGVALMMLYEEGKFQLDDPISKYIPEFADLKVFTGVDKSGNMKTAAPRRPPTIHDLMRHTAGFTYGYFSDTPVDRAYRKAELLNPRVPLKDFVSRLAEIPLLYQPGEQWVYSVSVDVQGYLVEVLSGQTFDAFLKERLFDPLGMTDTDFYAHEENHARLSTLYGPKDGKIITLTGPQYVDAYLAETPLKSGGGGLVSSTRDYFRFAQMLVNGGEFDGVRILSRKTVDYMGQNHLPGTVKIPWGNAGMRFGLDFGLITDAAQAGTIGSNSKMFWGGAASTAFWVDPEEDIVAVLMTQFLSGQEMNLPLREQFRALVYGAVME